MNKSALRIFIFSFIFVSIIQGIRMSDLDNTVDGSMWANQTKYVQIGDSRQFDTTAAYGHPGGPIIEGTILLHQVVAVSYTKGLSIFLVFFNALIIALVCVICFLLRKDYLWWVVILGTLSLDRLYNFATPPTMAVSPLIVLLCLLTLYFYENKEKISIPMLLFWSSVSGLAISTRADIGIFSTIFFLILLVSVIEWKMIFFTVIGIFASFVIFDPFMWYMPIHHVRDLISKMIFHYSEYAPTHLSILTVTSISMLAFVSMFFSVYFLLSKDKIRSPLPAKFSLTLLLMTVLLYGIFLTSRYQAERYYQPILSIWEVFLPLFIFVLIPRMELSFLKAPQAQDKAQKIIKLSFVVLLVGSQAFMFYWRFF